MIFWIVWFAIGVCFSVAFVCVILPKLRYKTYAASLPIRDRALGKKKEDSRTVFYYEPAASVRPYIKSYRLESRGNSVYFYGEWAKRIAFIKYELIVFNSANDIINILRVKERFNGKKDTHPTLLPKGADFVCLRILCIDDTPLPDERRAFNARYAIWLAVYSIVLGITVALMMWLAGTFLLRLFGNFTMRYELPTSVWLAFLGLTALAIAVLLYGLSIFRFFVLRRKGGEGDEG